MNLVSRRGVNTADYNVQSEWRFVVLGYVVSPPPVGAAAEIREESR